MNKKTIIFFISILLIFASCTQKETHFISDAQQRNDVENDLKAKMQQLPEGDLFSIFDTELTLKEREALQFLYAYMLAIHKANPHKPFCTHPVNSHKNDIQCAQ